MEVIEKAKQDWKKNHNINSVADIGWVKPDGSVVYYHNGGCHAALAYEYVEGGVPKGKNLVTVFSGIQNNKATLSNKDEAERTFIEWLLFHSPFKEAFLPDTTENALSYRVLMGDPDKPSNIMGAGLMSTRIFNEHPTVLQMWWEFVKRGLHPNIAFAFSHRMYIAGKKILPHIPVHTGCFNGSFAVSYYSGGGKACTREDYLLNFLQGKYDNLGKPYRSNIGEAISSFRLWAHPNKDSKGLPKVGEEYELLKKVGKKPSPPKNPFAKALPKDASGGAPDLDDAMEVLIPHLSKYKEFF